MSETLTEHDNRRGHRGPVLLAAARDLFFEQGYSGTTMVQVAQRAGLSKRATYLYFKNKDELFISVASAGLEILQAWLEEIDVEQGSLQSRIQRTMEVYLRFATDESQYFRIIFSEASEGMIANVSPELREQMARQERHCLAVVARIIERGVREGVLPPSDPWETAVIYWGTATGILLLSFGASQTVVGRSVREELIAKAVWLLFRGSNLAAMGDSAPSWPEEG
jgi:AcrR family transcriptional regulator